MGLSDLMYVQPWQPIMDLLQGVDPVLRTYNTLIIACNMCGQPREAMAVYRRMLDAGYSPNATTYNAPHLRLRQERPARQGKHPYSDTCPAVAISEHFAFAFARLEVHTPHSGRSNA